MDIQNSHIRNPCEWSSFCHSFLYLLLMRVRSIEVLLTTLFPAYGPVNWTELSQGKFRVLGWKRNAPKMGDTDLWHYPWCFPRFPPLFPKSPSLLDASLGPRRFASLVWATWRTQICPLQSHSHSRSRSKGLWAIPQLVCGSWWLRPRR